MERSDPPRHSKGVETGSVKRRSCIRFIFEGIEGLLIFGFVLFSWPLAKRWLINWGSLPEERERNWPGDQLVDSNRETFTRAITIDASADTVWCWIVQFGLGRAGFYSYELLERFVGIPVVNVESILPGMQSLVVGDEILLHPKAPGIPVAFIEPGKYICFGKNPDGEPEASATDPARSWSMYIESCAADTCRLLLRSCIEPASERSGLKRLATAFERAIDFVMEQRMLRTVKRLAELPGK